MKKVLVIVGPTAVGKTKLSLALAKSFQGEVISADSRLFYRQMDIGTAKPTKADEAQIPHHLINICDPDETVTLGEYQRLAYQSIDQLLNRGKLPIIVGGTGQYVMAVIEGWGIPEVSPQPLLRESLHSQGKTELYRWLEMLDPVAASKIDSRNMRRVIRALEVVFVKGRRISDLQQKNPPPYEFFIIGLLRDRDTLYKRIDKRVELMIQNGLISEVQSLKDRGYNHSLPAMSGLGYRQLLEYLQGNLTLDEAVQRIKYETHRFARQQSTWFRQDDPRIVWFDLSQDQSEQSIFTTVNQWLNT